MKNDMDKDVFFLIRSDLRQYVGAENVTDKVMLIFTISGKVSVRIDNQSYELNEDHLFFLHPRAMTVLESVSDDYSCAIVALPHVIQEAATLQMDMSFLFRLMKNPCWPLDNNMKKLVDGFCSMFEFVCNDDDIETKTELVTSLYIFLLKVLYEKSRTEQTVQMPQMSVSGRSLLSRFGKLLRAHYMEDHRVSYYADCLCVTPKYLTQVVKRTIGITPKDIIDRVLAIESLHQLRTTNLSIQQISDKLGFPDQSYFGRFFKRLFGFSPLQFRQNPNMEVLQILDDNLKKKYPNLASFNYGDPDNPFDIQ